MTEALFCSQCAAPIKPTQVRCDYCGFWLKQDQIDEEQDPEFVGIDLNQQYGRLTIAGLGFVFMSIFAMVILATMGGFSNIQSLWPTANPQTVSETQTIFLDILLGMLGFGTLLTTTGYAWHKGSQP